MRVIFTSKMSLINNLPYGLQKSCRKLSVLSLIRKCNSNDCEGELCPFVSICVLDCVTKLLSRIFRSFTGLRNDQIVKKGVGLKK